MPYIFDKAASNANNYDLLKEGEYEVFIEKAAIKTLSTGSQKISLQLRVRSDVEQEGKNRVIFEDIWKEKENPQFFNRKRLNQILGTQHFEDGKEFRDIDDLLQTITGANLIVKVGVDFDDYYKRDTNYISYYKTSKQQPKTLGAAPNPAPAKAGLEIADEDLPF